MKNTSIIIGIVVLLVIGGFFVFASSGKEKVSVNGDSINKIQGVQKFVLSTKNYNYYPNTITVKAGQPVSISLDKSVTGCFRSFTIKGLGLAKQLQSPGDTLEFTPTQKGTFRFACSMGMGYGTLIVE